MSGVIPADIQPAFPVTVPRDQVRAKLLELLGLDEIPGEVDCDAKTPRDEDGIRITRLTYLNSLGEKVPGILMVPLEAPADKLPGVVCIPGTSGSAAEVADSVFEEEGQVRGFGRELARRGYATLAISIKGTVGRRQTPARWEQEAKFLVAYGRPQMGIIAEEALRATRILAAQTQVDAARIGLTGMSLGGLATWYPMACDPRIRAGVPICGGVGSMARNIHEGLADRASSAIYIPHMLRYFDHPEIVAACIAPRPFMTIVPTRDEDMPPSGAAELIRRVTPVYESMDCPERFKVYQPEGNHQFLVPYFEWMVEWFDRFLAAEAA
jgi:dienelactone hydrolase